MQISGLPHCGRLIRGSSFFLAKVIFRATRTPFSNLPLTSSLAPSAMSAGVPFLNWVSASVLTTYWSPTVNSEEEIMSVTRPSMSILSALIASVSMANWILVASSLPLDWSVPFT